MANHAVETLLHSGTPPSDGEGTSEERLIGALDRAALRFIQVLEDDTRGDDGFYNVSFELRLDVFKTAMQWVATRRRTKIEDGEGSQAGVKSMQDRIAQSQNEPESRQPPSPPRRGPGRPSNAEIARRKKEDEEAIAAAARAGENDDSGWRARLAKANEVR